MSLIIRWIAAYPQQWQRRLTAAAEGEVEAPPSWALSDFIPKPGEGETISVFEIESEDFTEQVAAALAMSAPSFDRYVFIAAERDSLEAVGLELTASAGDTNHRQVDEWHRDLHLRSHVAVMEAVSLFTDGVLFPVEKALVQGVLTREIRQDKFEWKKVAAKKPFQQRLAGYVDTSLKIEGYTPETATQTR